ncbi:hypothetical protein A2W14_06110 [Candidatus Gottesmanbacteria bacterium RBG_16_37_8]|uniref:Uncharacterized protein n=1 Tax=Candidatus Gottesmanbacteria bacterium RBG_16_37_8 TaxID=1798371 RepID=A0A1F5YQU4_9BACT|nr:MAG: hypothetical protein A2W14_06110 [Candidatus Gottesmanbacteria bacterium RBG_16_37_8]
MSTSKQEIVGAQRLEGFKIGFLSSPNDFIYKYSLEPGEQALRGDPRLLDFLPPVVMDKLRGDFQSLAPENQQRIAEKMFSSRLSQGNQEKLWRALLLSNGGKMHLGNWEFITYQDRKGDLVPAGRDQTKEDGHYVVLAGFQRGLNVEDATIPIFSDLMIQPEEFIDSFQALSTMINAADNRSIKDPQVFYQLFQKIGLNGDHLNVLLRIDPIKYFNLARLLVVANEGSLPVGSDEPRSYLFLSQGMDNQEGIGYLGLARKVTPSEIITYNRARIFSEVSAVLDESQKTSTPTQVYGVSNRQSLINQSPHLERIIIRKVEQVGNDEPLHEIL